MSNKECAPMCIMLTSRDVQKSVAFYKDKLGFAMEQSWPDDKNPMWCNMMLNNQSVMLGAQMSPEQAGEMCAGDPGSMQYMKTLAEEFKKNQVGVGIITYIKVDDVDAYHAKLVKAGVQGLGTPKTQFYGLRDFGLQDPDGYRFLFYTNVKMDNCASCGMPLTEAKPGQMYCQYCTDDKGTLKQYETVLEGTATGYFMQMQKMPKDKALVAAKEHLSKMPAWSHRK